MHFKNGRSSHRLHLRNCNWLGGTNGRGEGLSDHRAHLTIASIAATDAGCTIYVRTFHQSARSQSPLPSRSLVSTSIDFTSSGAAFRDFLRSVRISSPETDEFVTFAPAGTLTFPREWSQVPSKPYGASTASIVWGRLVSLENCFNTAH